MESDDLVSDLLDLKDVIDSKVGQLQALERKLNNQTQKAIAKMKQSKAESQAPSVGSTDNG